MALSNTYTVSPLGIITGSVGSYGTASTYQSLLSSYSKNGVRRKLNKNTSTYATGGSAVLSDKRHSDEIYDISTSNIIEKLDKPSTAHISLNYADFAYLRDFGVYPNNRLIVCRRYPVPVVDDLYSLPAQGNGKAQAPTPLSTVLGYVPQTEDFINFSFNEEWADAEASFTNILNSLGEDFGFKGQFQLGSILEGAVNVIPLPGASLLLQRSLMAKLGLFGDAQVNGDGVLVDGSGNAIATSGVPQGDPNLIKQALQRTLIDENKDGSGLKCKFNITLKTVYEQKFIQGVDPTIVFMDIMNNLLNLGTSNATFYLGKQTDAGNEVSKYLKAFMADPFTKIKEFIKALIDSMADQLTKFKNLMVSLPTSVPSDKSKPGAQGDMATEISSVITKSIDGTKGYIQDFINQKYKVKFLGIINALTGGPSTPWHVTIGNPLRPIFCSGDMLTKSVNVKLGPQLSFNDLPTFIEVEVQLESARNLGLQEIFGKFNCGGIRTSTGDYIVDDSDSYWNTSTYPYSGTGSVALGSALGSQTITNMSAGVNNSSSSATASRTRVSPGGIPNQFE